MDSFHGAENNEGVSTHEDRARRRLPLILGAATLAGVALLLGQDAAPQLFPAPSHAVLAALSLAMIACAYLVFEIAHGPAAMALAKASVLAAAFLFWAANQLWPGLPQAQLFNDVAIGLFVLDVFLTMAGWPPRPKAGSLQGSKKSEADRV
jgi:hypothetical protein